MICCETTCPWSAMEQPVHGLLGNNLPMICWGTICPWSTREQFVYDLLGKNLSIIYWGTICPRSTREQPAHDLLGNNLSIIYWGTICPWYAEAQPVHDLLANNLSMMCRGEKKKKEVSSLVTLHVPYLAQLDCMIHVANVGQLLDNSCLLMHTLTHQKMVSPC